MCEYCDGIYRGNQIMVYNAIDFGNEKWVLSLTDFNEKTRIIASGIKFCPMCGRKLESQQVPKRDDLLTSANHKGNYMKREELKICLAIDSTAFYDNNEEMYCRAEADSVMDALEYDIRIYQDIVAKAEARIKELEDELKREHRVGEDWCAKYWDLRAMRDR